MVQALLGKTWKGFDIDIFCQEEVAPFVRSWLREEGQVFSGLSEMYNAPGRYQRSISHVEYYSNRDDEKFNYLDAVSNGERHMTHILPKSSRRIDIVTADGEAMPFIPFTDLGTIKKQIVNIDLVVIRRGATVCDALDAFDLSICSASFNGSEWSIPNPVDSFSGVSDLTSTPMNALVKTYISNLKEQSNRELKLIAKEMDLFKHKQRYGKGVTTEKLQGFLEIIGDGNVFSPRLTRPIVFIRSAGIGTYQGADFPLICVVLDIRARVISNALDSVRHLIPHTIPRLVSSKPRLLHNFIIGTSVKRYDKYLQRGISISGLPGLREWKVLRGHMLRRLPGFSDVVRGRRWLYEDVPMASRLGQGNNNS